MSKREDRERARMMSMLPDEGVVAAEILAATSKLGDTGDEITPELATLASQVAGAEAAVGGSRRDTRLTTAAWSVASMSTSDST